MKKQILFLIAAALILTISSCTKNNNAQYTFNCSNLSHITTNTTIPAGIYTVSCNIEVANGATLTIAPGTSLLFSQGNSLTVDAGGSLIATGTSAMPISFKGNQSTPGYWQGIFINSISLNNTFAYCTISDAGASTGAKFGADVTIQDGSASFTNCTISGSSDAGIYLSTFYNTQDVSAFSSFSNNTVTANGSYPIIGYCHGVSSIGSGNTFTANQNNYIGILSSEVKVNVTLNPLSVPYLIVQTGSNSGVTIDNNLIINAGTTLVMGSGTNILCQTTGSINAVGTAGNRITIKGLQATAGYWGSVIVQSNNTLNNFQYCTFFDGGGIPAYPIEIYANSVGELSTYMYIPVARSINVQNCSFANSGSAGIYVSATDGPPTVPPTYNTSTIVSSNTFSGCSPNVKM